MKTNDQEEGAATKATPERGGDASSGRQRGNFSDNGSKPLVILWRESVCDDSRLSTMGTCVLFVLSRYMSAAGSGRPSASTIAKGRKLNKSTGRDIVGRELANAVRLGLLSATPREGYTTIYQAVLPAFPEGAGGACFEGAGSTQEGDLPALSGNLPALEGDPACSGQARNRREVDIEVDKEVGPSFSNGDSDSPSKAAFDEEILSESELSSLSPIIRQELNGNGAVPSSAAGQLPPLIVEECARCLRTPARDWGQVVLCDECRSMVAV